MLEELGALSESELGRVVQMSKHLKALISIGRDAYTCELDPRNSSEVDVKYVVCFVRMQNVVDSNTILVPMIKSTLRFLDDVAFRELVPQGSLQQERIDSMRLDNIVEREKEIHQQQSTNIILPNENVNSEGISEPVEQDLPTVGNCNVDYPSPIEGSRLPAEVEVHRSGENVDTSDANYTPIETPRFASNTSGEILFQTELISQTPPIVTPTVIMPRIVIPRTITPIILTQVNSGPSPRGLDSSLSDSSNMSLVSESSKKRKSDFAELLKSKKRSAKPNPRVAQIGSYSDLRRLLQARLRPIDQIVMVNTAKQGAELATKLQSMERVTEEFIGQCQLYIEFAGLAEYYGNVLWGGIFLKTLQGDWSQGSANLFVKTHKLIMRKFTNMTNAVLCYWLFLGSGNKYYFTHQDETMVDRDNQLAPSAGYSLDIVRSIYEGKNNVDYVQFIQVLTTLETQE